MNSNQETKDYLDRRFSRENSTLYHIRTQSQAADLPKIHLPVYLGNFIYLLAKIQSPKKILEIGTLGGYSTGCLSQALPPNGVLISLEVNPYHVLKAREHLQIIKDRKIEIREGQAISLLAQMVDKEEEPFDLIFIDADKENNVLYLEWALKLSKVGTLIIIDNIIPKSEKVGYSSYQQAEDIYAFNDYLAQHPDLEIAAIPTLVDTEARLDGLALAIVKNRENRTPYFDNRPLSK